MKKFGIFFALSILGLIGFAQNGNGSHVLNVSSVQVSDGIGDQEVVEIRVSGSNVSEINGMMIDFDGARAVSLPMTKTTTENNNAPGNSGTNGTDVWIVTLDLDLYTDVNGTAALQLRPSCCYIPQGGIVVRSKGR
jgi:hypothetical protein